MARVPTATQDSIPSDQKTAFQEVVEQRGEVPAAGPASIMINVPEIAKRAGHLSDYLRNESTLSSRVQELAMLVTARELDCQYIWNAHAAAGRKAGLRDELVDNLRDKKDLTGLIPEESAVINYGREFFRTHKVTRDIFDAARSQFGIRGLTELTNLMGYYALLAFNINAFGVELPADRTEAELPI
jgi:4-carboxymuconolactone decarboxylase